MKNKESYCYGCKKYVIFSDHNFVLYHNGTSWVCHSLPCLITFTFHSIEGMKTDLQNELDHYNKEIKVLLSHKSLFTKIKEKLGM